MKKGISLPFHPLRISMSAKDCVLPFFIHRYIKSLSCVFTLSTDVVFLLKILFIYFRHRGSKGEREGEKHQGVVASHTPPARDLACNPGMWPDWESNRQPFGSQGGTQSTEPPQPGRRLFNNTVIFGAFNISFPCSHEVREGGSD